MGNFSNILIIFDENIDVSSFHKELPRSCPKSIDIFPLTSNWRLILDIKSTILNLFNDSTQIKLIESAKLINNEVDVIREKVTKWSADFGNKKIAGKSIKEWFLLPKREVSTWWFSLLSEKNSFKTDAFLRLAQLKAIDKIISSNSIDSCFLSVADKTFLLSIEKICKRHFLDTLHLSSLKRKKLLKEKMKFYLNQQNTFSFTLKALIHLFFRVLRSIRAKFIMGPIKNRVEKHGNSVLFVSYFPAVDKKAAKKGILKNKYAIPLQEKLLDMGKKIIWIWKYWPIDEHSYSDALTLAKKFKKNGEANFLLDEFMSLKVLIKVLFLWIRQFRIFLRLKKLIPIQAFYKNLSILEGAVFIKNLMARSFIGWIGLEGILFFELFKEVFSHFSYPTHCIYYLEMQSWENTLNAAKKIKAPQVKSIGFQHVAIFRNLTYFHHPSEMCQDEKSISFPLPDIFACNGDIPLLLMSRCNYPNLTKVEAIRYLYLSDFLGNSDISVKRNIALIAGSTDIQETRALISLFHAAFPKPRGFEVWLKGHPALPFLNILKELGIDIRKCGYLIKYDPIVKLLGPVKILIVGSSTVAMEGLARCCRVITPIFNDKIFMSPLKGFEELYVNVQNPQELRSAIRQAIQSDRIKQNSDKVKKFISRYFCLDQSLKRWEELLTENSC